MMDSNIKYLDVSFNKQNVTNILSEDLESWTYTDNLSGEIDDLQLVLSNLGDKKWLNEWFPTKGTIVQAKICQKYYDPGTSIQTLVGTFEIDEIEFNGYPSTVTIKALSVPISTSLRGEMKSKTWEDTTVRLIAESIASANGLSLIYQADITEKKNVEQDNETDLSFLYKICNSEGLCLKLSSRSIVILDEADYEANDVAATFSMINRDTNFKVSSWSAKNTTNGIFKACRVENIDSSGDNSITTTFSPSPAINVGSTLVVKSNVETTEEASRLAKKKLREKNKQATTVQIVVVCNAHFDAGMTVQLTDFGKLNGKYIITRVVNTANNQTLSLRRCLVGY